ncbi:Histone-lysine N-methyltransferase SETMAR [Eumeta japonica]|uniref:Histone-lysine N-methyltransferase SETMAR n=1 Tax=Eumeta variegata TaxID=151549 RepID=A0A4C1XZV8_EUMVA|nr:Histone-lysine N-methyltransferase SETMAR [Eumeta japonica]
MDYVRQERAKKIVVKRQKGVVFDHDNASPHTSLPTHQILREFGWEVLMHPPCSLDLAPSDFQLFRSLQNSLETIEKDKALTHAANASAQHVMRMRTTLRPSPTPALDAGLMPIVLDQCESRVKCDVSPCGNSKTIIAVLRPRGGRGHLMYKQNPRIAIL